VDEMTSRERLLTTIAHQEPDRVPICFRGVAPLDIQWNSRLERIIGLAELGVDDKLPISVPWVYHPDVEVRQWWETRTGIPTPVMVKELETPKGVLRWAVRETEDYAPADLFLVADQNWSRGLEFPINGREDLEKLPYILYDPRRADLSGFRQRAAALKSFADLHDVLVEGSAVSISNVAFCFLGSQRLFYLAMDDRDFVVALLEMAHDWVMGQVEVLLDIGVDTIYSSGCYETVEFWSPDLIRELFLPYRREEARVIHQAGAKFHYFTQTGIMPLLEDYEEIGIDILSALDPLGVGGARHAVDLAQVKRTIGDAVCLWGGVDPEHTVEMGTPQEIRETVRDVIRVCAPSGGFVLSTSGSIYSTDATTRDHVMTFIEAGHEYGRYPS